MHSKKMKSKVYLSVIVPVFNEYERAKNLKNIANYLKKQKYTSELIVVDDGSNLDAKKIVQKLSKELRFKIISYKENQGKGYAIKQGMIAARGKYRLFIDVDLSTPIEEIKNFLPIIKGEDVVIASRRISRSNIIEHQSFFRESMGRVFTLLSQMFLLIKVSDFTCGFKCFSQAAAIEIFSKTKIKRWGFDPETLYIAKKLGYEIHEVPVSWKNDPYSRVKFPQDVIRSFVELIQVRVYDVLGKYS